MILSKYLNSPKRKNNMNRGDEERLSRKWILALRSLEEEYKIHVGSKVKVISDFTCLKEKSDFKLAIGFSEVDIAIYRKNPFNKRDQKVLKFFKFLQDSKKDEEFINIPFIILELKSGEITSDAIRARNEVARKIRNIFPFCAYFFIGDKTSKRRETLFRQGKSFNNFFVYKDEISEKEINKIITEFIKPYLENLKTLNLLPPLLHPGDEEENSADDEWNA